MADIKAIEQQLEQLQRDLVAAKQQQATKAARQKMQDAIQMQRALSQSVVDTAESLYLQWKTRIEDSLPDAAERLELKTKIDAASDEVSQAEAQVTRLTQQIVVDENAVTIAKASLAGLEKENVDTQKELSQLPAKIKEAQRKVEQLRSEVTSAIDAGSWRRAYYKHYRLKPEIDAAKKLLAATDEEKRIIDALDGLATAIGTAQTASTLAKKKLDEDKDAQKVALQEYNDKQQGLETAIANFL